MGKFKNTRIAIFPNYILNKNKPDTIGTMIEMTKLQEMDAEALCISKKVKTIKGRALTRSFVWLSDEALYAIYLMLHDYFNEKVKKNDE